MQVDDMSEKVIRASHDLLMLFFWLDDRLSPKLPRNGDSKVPEI